MSEANFNSVAAIYDKLAFIVFGKSIRTSQTYFLDLIKNNSDILILGGGTGYILEALSDLNLELRVDYIDNSSKMIDLSKKRKFSDKVKVNFISGNHASIPEKKFDVIHAAFFLDLFELEKLFEVIKLIKSSLKNEGKLLVAEFRISKEKSLFQKPLSSLMHMFFRTFCKLQSKELQNINTILVNEGFSLNDVHYFYNRFIFSAIYSKD